MKKSQERKRIISFHPKRKSQRVHSLSGRIPIETCTMGPHSTRAKCKTKFKGRMDVVARSKALGDLITTEHTILNVGNESRCGHRNAYIVKKDCRNWIEGYPMKKETSHTMVFFFTSFFLQSKSPTKS